MSTSTLHIVCAIDDDFKLPLSVMLLSLFETNKKHKLKIHLLSANLSDENIIFFENLTISRKQEFRFYQLDLDTFKEFPVDKRISFAAYYRLVAPEVLDSSIDRYIYFDADIIIERDLFELWNTDLKGNIIGAIHDIFAIRDKYYVTHNIDHQHLYFNSGVLLVDTKLWIKFNATHKIAKYITYNKKLCQFHDQDGLNVILHDKRLPLIPEWNQQIGIYVINQELLCDIFGCDNFKRALYNPAVVHFNGNEKPWWYLCGHPYKQKFLDYLKKAGLSTKYKDVSLINFIKLWRYRVFGWQHVNKRIYNP